MNYGEILSKAWKIIWKNKILWVFAFLAGLIGSNGGGGGAGGGNVSSIRNMGNNNFNGNNPQQWFNNFGNQMGTRITNFVQSIPVWVWIFGVLVIIFITLLFIGLGVMGRIGLMRGAWKADQAEQKLSFGQLWRESMPFFWRMIGLGLLVFAASLLLIAVIGLPLLLFGVLTMGIGMLLVIPLLCVLIPVLWLVGLLVEQATIAMVCEDLSIFKALERAWKVMTRNLGGYVLMAIILWIGAGILGFLLALPMIAVMIPLFIAIFAQSNVALGMGAIISGVLFLLYLPILIVIGSALRAYVTSAWVVTFRRGRDILDGEVSNRKAAAQELDAGNLPDAQ